MPNYKNGKVYKLVNSIDNLIYIGSTTCRLSTRMSLHRLHAKKNYNANLYKHMNKLGINKFKIVLIEYCSCNSKDELLRRERYIFDIHDKKYYSIQIDHILLVLKRYINIDNVIKYGIIKIKHTN